MTIAPLTDPTCSEPGNNTYDYEGLKIRAYYQTTKTIRSILPSAIDAAGSRCVGAAQMWPYWVCAAWALCTGIQTPTSLCPLPFLPCSSYMLSLDPAGTAPNLALKLFGATTKPADSTALAVCDSVVTVTGGSVLGLNITTGCPPGTYHLDAYKTPRCTAW